MPNEEFRIATEPLFRSNQVDVVEWSFDVGWGRPLPRWLQHLLAQFSRREMLLGHGVSYSVLDASETSRQSGWLQKLAMELQRYRYTQVSEHFGFMGGGNFRLASPLPVPRTDMFLRIGHERLRQLATVAGVPIGLENLAFAFSADDVRQQGEFLDALLARSMDSSF